MYISVVRVFKSGEMRYDSEKRKTRFFRKKLYVISLITIESLIARFFNSKVSPFRFACANGGTDVLVRRVSCTIQGWNYEESVSTINPRSLNGRLQTCNFSRGKCHRVLVSTRYNRITFQCSFIKVLRDSVVAGYDNACINNNRLTKTKRITGTRVDNRRIAWVGYKSALSPTNGEKINLDFFQRSNVHVCTGFPIARKYTFTNAIETSIFIPTNHRAFVRREI